MRCVDCKYAEWERTATGRIKKKTPGRCTATVPVPTVLCIFKPIYVNKSAIWPTYDGQCDLFEQEETKK